MRRLTIHLSVVSCLMAAVFAIVQPGSGIAQEEMSMADHPLVGTWYIAEAQAPDDPFMVAFLSDGVAIQHEGSGVAAFGVWEATGPATANATFHTRLEEEEYAEVITIRAAFEVAPDGLTLTGEYTAQIVTAEGSDVGELGPGAVVGTRMQVEAMGTPVAGFEEFDEEATPAD